MKASDSYRISCFCLIILFSYSVLCQQQSDHKTAQQQTDRKSPESQEQQQQNTEEARNRAAAPPRPPVGRPLPAGSSRRDYQQEDEEEVEESNGNSRHVEIDANELYELVTQALLGEDFTEADADEADAESFYGETASSGGGGENAAGTSAPLHQAKVVAAIVQEVDSSPFEDVVDDQYMSYDTNDADTLGEEEKPQTPEQVKAAELFDLATRLINASKTSQYHTNMRRAYKLLEEAATLGHEEALELVGFAFLFGDYLPWNPRRAREIFEDLSLRGSPRGQTGLGFMYTAGITINSSQAKALVYLQFAALGGDSWAQMALGYRYWSGINLHQNCESALTYYRKVAQKVASEVSLTGGSILVRTRLAEDQDGGSQSSQLMDDDLLQYYRFLADKGDVQAQVGLAQLYYTGGRGVEQNYEQAFHYFSEAAEAGNANAYAYLGKMHLDGTPTLQADNATALQYFKRAADKGNPVGQSGLGLMHLYGKGVEKNYAKALKYFQAAADQGWVDGQLQLGTMYFSGLGVKRDYKLATKYFQLASQSGHVLGFYNLAQMHATGTGTMRNCHTATELYKNVAERGRWSEMLMQAHAAYREGLVDQAALKYLFLAELGYEVAQSNIAYLLDSDQVGMFEQWEMFPRALVHWERAAEQGSGLARLKLGDYHYYGYGTPVDYAQAAQHYKIASEQQHNAQAMFNLAFMHEQGLGIKHDIHLAKRFYDLAAETSTDAQVPVTLALAKLGFLFAWHYFQDNPWWKLTFIDAYFGAEWDVYVITVLCIVLATLIYYRMHR